MHNRVPSAPSRFLGVALLLTAAACADTPVDPGSTATPAGPSASLAGLAWTSGSPSGANGIVPPSALRELPGGLVGIQYWKSNNPESFKGEGWLMSSGSTASQRGGTATALRGPVALYFSHLNQDNLNTANKTDSLYLHLIATNPGNDTIVLNGKGAANANNRWRHLTTDPAIRSAWYLTSDNWLRNTLTTISNVKIGPKKAAQVMRIRVPGTKSGGPAFAAEGRYELDVTGPGAVAPYGAYFYLVATLNGDLNRAINIASGVAGYPGQAPGHYHPATDTTYGREAGIASHSAWYSGDVTLTLPTTAGVSHMGFAFNTNGLDAGGIYHEQTAPFSMRLAPYASYRTYGGYGHKYNVKLILKNPGAARRVRLSLASNPIDGSYVPQLTFDAPVAIEGGATQTIVPVHLTPSAPRKPLITLDVPAGTATTPATVIRNVVVFIPGLGSDGQQLIVESGVP